MDYQTYIPAESLSDFVKCYWSLEAKASAKPEKQRIVPDGCMEMIFHYGDLFKQYRTDGTVIIQPRCFVFGQVTAALDIEPTGATGVFAVRFLPGGFTPFTAMTPEEMENKAVALEDIFAEEGALLEKQVIAAASSEERRKIAEDFLFKKLYSSQGIDRVAHASVETLLQANGQLSVDALAQQLTINRRQLERKFSAVIGLSPKQLAKIIRLQAALKMLDKKQYTSLTDLAYGNGYFDQAHFIKDFKEFTGMTPKQFYAGNLSMSALFIGG